MKNIWENPEIQSFNRLEIRSPLINYESEELALNEVCTGPENLTCTKSKNVKSLDGMWDFKLVNNPDTETEELKNWYSEDFKDSFDKIRVPGTWSLQGFDHPHYTNVQMPFDTLPPSVPEDNPTGLYKIKVKLPENWNNKRIVLHIGSAESTTILYVNGNLAGISKDTRLPCEFDISQFISDYSKEVLIAIKVVRYSDASFVEDQDQWWFGGIHRSVYLYATNNLFIEDVEAITKIENQKSPLQAEGTIPLNIKIGYSDIFRKLENKDLDTKKYSVEYKLFKLNGHGKNITLGNLIQSDKLERTLNYRQNQFTARTVIKVNEVSLWSHENPQLYLLLISLYDENNSYIESVSFTTGFKSVEVKNRELLINGKMVYIKGVNRHEHSELNGKTLSTEEMLKDIKTMKSYNFNAVRTCHYPDDERWYELCNRYGLYILDEANIENHAYYDCIARSDLWMNAYMQRITRMVRRDKNNVCIFGWSLGNESGDGQNQVAANAWIRRVDPTRIVHYEGFVRPEWTQGDFTLDSLARGKGLTDFIGPMYPGIALIKEYAKTREDYRPIIMCEYSHAMGNANGSIADYWDAIYSTHGLQGGFIWDWIDQGLAATSPEGKSGESQGGKYWKYGGDFGDSPSDYDFCLNGIMFPDQTTKPAMEECKYLFCPVKIKAVHKEVGIYEVINHQDFLTLENIELKYEILANGKVLESGKISLPETAPEHKSEIKIPYKKNYSNCNEQILIHFYFVYKNDTPFTKKDSVLGYEEFKLNENCSLESLLKIDTNNCCDLNEAKKIAEEFLPVIFRPLTENECVKRELPTIFNEPTPWAFFNKPTPSWIKYDLPGALIEKNNDSFKIYTGSKSSVKEILAEGKSNYREIETEKGKAIQLQVEMELSQLINEYPCVGISVPVKADYKNIQWYGKGPHECYSDRKRGAMSNLYTKKIDELEVPYIVPQENGSRCDTKYLQLSSGTGKKNIHIASLTDFTFNVSKYSKEDLWKCEHRNELIDLSKGENGIYILTIYAALRGVGTGACGPDTMEPYKVKPGKYNLNIILW